MHRRDTSFSNLLQALRQSTERPSLTVPRDWLQGRTIYGGLAAALCLEACQRVISTPGPLRAAQFAFVGPASGRLEFDCTTLRQGKSTVFAGVDLITHHGLATRAIFCFGSARSSALSYADLAAPEVVNAEQCAPFFTALPPTLTFAQHFDWRFAGGARPLTADAEPEMLLWVRHCDKELVPSMVSLLALADAPPPAAMVRFTTPALISTMTWSLEVLDDTVATDDGWWLIKTSAQTIRDGYSSQAMTVWNSRRTPVLAARQSVAVFT